MKEEWKYIDGYENLYKISNKGNVFGIKSNRLKIVRINNGYCICDLYKNGLLKSKKVHRLIAKAFIPNPLNKPHINHKDGNRSNNSLKNLEWVTSKENSAHAIKLGLITKKQIKKMVDASVVKNSKPVLMLSLGNEPLLWFDSITEAENNFTSKVHGTISKCCRNIYKTAFGYKWEYYNECL